MAGRPKNPVKVDPMAAALAQEYGDEIGFEGEPPPITPQGPKKLKPWSPDLNPTQQKIFDDGTTFILCAGEKGSGKTLACAHKIIRHAYECENALVIIISPTIRTGNEGIWYDLETLVLPQWLEGMGLEFTPSKLDPLTKDRHRWIRNRHGGWSKLLLMSIPHASMVQDRIKGPAPSMVYVDELTNCDGPEYFTFIALQLGRRRGNQGVPQQYLASCNPEGPSHWVYKTFYVDCVNQETGQRDPSFAVYHVPISENMHRLPPGYALQVQKITKNDPTEYDRLVLGKWVDRPAGDGIFKEFYIPVLHMKPSDLNLIKAGHGLMPKPGNPIHFGYDLGIVNSSITMLQQVPTRNGSIWFVFDEIDKLDSKILYKSLAFELVERIQFWNKKVGYRFAGIHTTDESAINMWRPGEGCYDATLFEREFGRAMSLYGRPDDGSEVEEIKLMGCPKGAGSVAARVQILRSMLRQEEFFVSAQCKGTIDMLLFLIADKDNPEKPKRSKHLHKFDSLTYPIFRMNIITGGGSGPQTAQVAPRIVSCGNG